MVTEHKKSVVIVGGGVAGLVCAWALSKADIPVRLVEASPSLGGRCVEDAPVTIDWSNTAETFTSEHGVHGIWTGYRQLTQIIKELGVEKRLVEAPTQGFIFRRGDGGAGCLEIGRSVRQSALPTALAPLSMLRSREILRDPAAFIGHGEMIPASLKQILGFNPYESGSSDATNADGFVQGWPPLIRQLMTALCRSAFFAEPREISTQALLTALWAYGIGHKRNSEFKLFENGVFQDLINPLASAVRAQGGELLTGWRCTGVKFGARGVEGINAIDLNRRRKHLKAGAVILALDPPGLRKLAKGALADHLQAFSIPDGVGSLVVRLWYPGKPEGKKPWTGLLSHGPADAYFWLHHFDRATQNWHIRTGGSCVELHCYANNARRLSIRDHAEITDEMDRTVGWAWPEVGPRLHGHVRVNPPTHPRFDPEGFERLPPVSVGIPGLSLCGDWIHSGQPTLFMERAAVTGLRAAQEATAHLGLSLSELPVLASEEPPSRSLSILGPLARFLSRSHG